MWRMLQVHRLRVLDEYYTLVGIFHSIKSVATECSPEAKHPISLALTLSLEKQSIGKSSNPPVKGHHKRERKEER